MAPIEYSNMNKPPAGDRSGGVSPAFPASSSCCPGGSRAARCPSLSSKWPFGRRNTSSLSVFVHVGLKSLGSLHRQPCPWKKRKMHFCWKSAIKSAEITHLPVIGSRGQKTTNLRPLGVPEWTPGAVFGALWRLSKSAQRHFTKDFRLQPHQRTPKSAFQDQEKCFLDAMENIWGPSGHFGGAW